MADTYTINSGRPGMPIIHPEDSPRFNSYKEAEEEGTLGDDTVVARKFPGNVAPFAEALHDKKMQKEQYAAAVKDGRVSDAKGRFKTTSEATCLHILGELIPLDPTLGLNFPIGREINLDDTSPKLDKRLCDKIQAAAKAARESERQLENTEIRAILSGSDSE